jgi:hypothetical protein
MMKLPDLYSILDVAFEIFGDKIVPFDACQQTNRIAT